MQSSQEVGQSQGQSQQLALSEDDDDEEVTVGAVGGGAKVNAKKLKKGEKVYLPAEQEKEIVE